MRRELREILTRHGMSEVSGATLASFGVLGAIYQVLLAVWPQWARHDWWILCSLSLGCLLFGIAHAWPKLTIRQSYKHPDFTIEVKSGDLFSERGNLVIGFTDTFDTELEGGVVIHPSSVQGQFQSRYYRDDIERLDASLDVALRGHPIVARESRELKPSGKLARYAVGTTAVINADGVKFYALAYGRMGNDFRVTSSVDSIWKSLGCVWSIIRAQGSLEPVAMPVIGSELARIGSMDRNSLIKMIALSFTASMREDMVSRKLSIVVHPKDRNYVDMVDIKRFLKTL
ncbi:macro domain-containing protein [Streptomyces mirabilis]|uniref:macro domain-containing protein n=1 Tax=Streptomyces mirabilis TaxID=68239 RepID=UPI003692EB66